MKEFYEIFVVLQALMCIQHLKFHARCKLEDYLIRDWGQIFFVFWLLLGELKVSACTLRWYFFAV